MQHLPPGHPYYIFVCQPLIQPHQLLLLLCIVPVALPARAIYQIISLWICLIDSFNSTIDIHNGEAMSLLEDHELKHLELHGYLLPWHLVHQLDEEVVFPSHELYASPLVLAAGSLCVTFSLAHLSLRS